MTQVDAPSLPGVNKFQKNSYVMINVEHDTPWLKNAMVRWDALSTLVFKVKGYVIKGPVVVYRVEHNQQMIDQVPEDNLVACPDEVVKHMEQGARWRTQFNNKAAEEKAAEPAPEAPVEEEKLVPVDAPAEENPVQVDSPDKPADKEEKSLEELETLTAPTTPKIDTRFSKKNK